MGRQGTGGRAVLSKWHLLPVISTSTHCILLLDLSRKIQLVKHWLEHGLVLLIWMRQSIISFGGGHWSPMARGFLPAANQDHWPTYIPVCYSRTPIPHPRERI